ncbi:MAG TPA: hypothetical protein VGH28_05770 [Polyangiaceae bacterium]
MKIAAACAVVCAASSARAEGPVVVSYTAPPECASAEAFHALLANEIARTPNPDRPWRFSVSITHEGDYVGTLETEASTRELRAPTCDDVTAALALVIATAEPTLPAPGPPPITPIVQAPRAPAIAERDRATNKTKSPFSWRFGVGAQQWSDGSELQPTGAMLTASVEVPWGLSKTMFELGAGALFPSSKYNTTYQTPGGGTLTPSQPWLVVDAQVCPLDVPLGPTGLSILGCGIGVVGNDGSLAAWAGGGGRLRWQSPWSMFVEGHFNGLYGTRFEGIPALMDFGGSLGFRI